MSFFRCSQPFLLESLNQTFSIRTQCKFMDPFSAPQSYNAAELAGVNATLVKCPTYLWQWDRVLGEGGRPPPLQRRFDAKLSEKYVFFWALEIPQDFSGALWKNGTCAEKHNSPRQSTGEEPFWFPGGVATPLPPVQIQHSIPRGGGRDALVCPSRASTPHPLGLPRH